MLNPKYGYLGGWEIAPGVSIGSVFLLGVGSIVFGLPIMWLISRRKDTQPFFRGETLTADTPVKAPED